MDELETLLKTFGSPDFETELNRCEWILDTLVREKEDLCLDKLDAYKTDILTMNDQMDNCIETLDNLCGDLDLFGTEMLGLLNEVKSINERSEIVAGKVEQDKQLYLLLKTYIEHILITPQLEAEILTGNPVTESYRYALEQLENKLRHAEEPGFQNYPSNQDVRKKLYELKYVAYQRSKTEMLNLIPQLGLPAKITSPNDNNRDLIPENVPLSKSNEPWNGLSKKDHQAKELRNYTDSQGVVLFPPMRHLSQNLKIYARDTSHLFRFIQNQYCQVESEIQKPFVSVVSKAYTKLNNQIIEQVDTIRTKSLSAKAFQNQLVDCGCPRRHVETAGFSDLPTWQSIALPTRVASISPLASVKRLALDNDELFQERLVILKNWSDFAPSSSALFPEEKFTYIISQIYKQAEQLWKFLLEYFFQKSLSQDPSENLTNNNNTHDVLILYENVFLQSLLLVKHHLVNLIVENYDLVSLALIWRVIDSMQSDAISRNVFPACENLFTSLQNRVSSQIIKMLDFFSKSIDMVAKSLRNHRKQYLNESGPEGASQAYYLLVIAVFTRVMTIAAHSPPTQKPSLSEKLDKLRESIQMAIDGIGDLVLLDFSNKIDNGLFKLVCLDFIQNGLARHTTDACAFQETITEIQEWCMARNCSVFEQCSDMLFTKNYRGLKEQVQIMEDFIEKLEPRDEISQETRKSIQEQIVHQEEGWQHDLDTLKNVTEDKVILQPFGELRAKVLRHLYSLYIVYACRFQKCVDKLNLSGQGLPTSSAMLAHVRMNQLFRFFTAQEKVELWLVDRVQTRITGTIKGFDEYMNLVLENAEELTLNKMSERSPDKMYSKTELLGTILLKSDNVILIAPANIEQ